MESICGVSGGFEGRLNLCFSRSCVAVAISALRATIAHLLLLLLSRCVVLAAMCILHRYRIRALRGAKCRCFEGI